MAGREHALTLGDEDLLPVWRTVIALSEVMDTSDLTVVGGLMVHLHARRGGVEMPRSTDDADFLVNVLVDRGGLTRFSAGAGKLGFELKRDERHAYRSAHADGRKVDVLVADHLPAHIRPRLARLPALAADGGQQAIDRRDLYTLAFTSGRVRLGVPDEIGALVAKGAAYMIDQRDAGRHLDDAAALLASITDASELDYTRSTRSDRGRLRVIDEKLSDETAVPWVNLTPEARIRGRLNLRLVAAAMGV